MKGPATTCAPSNPSAVDVGDDGISQSRRCTNMVNPDMLDPDAGHHPVE
jgi:hypothetical protein